jgi:hypothetical protein
MPPFRSGHDTLAALRKGTKSVSAFIATPQNIADVRLYICVRHEADSHTNPKQEHELLIANRSAHASDDENPIDA